MNSCSLTSDSARRWWPSAAAAIAAILVLPAAVQAAPEPLAPTAPAGPASVVVTQDRPCFLHRAHWNEALDGPQPRCGGVLTQPVSSGVARAGLGYLP